MNKYKTINGWTKQSMLDHVKFNFRGKSQGPVYCEYRGPEGRKCAVGLFIPDDRYEPKMEVVGSISALQYQYPDLMKLFPLAVEPMSQFQYTHDSMDDKKLSIAEQTVFLVTWIEQNVEDGAAA